ncbi:MAG: glycosyltransferase family 2 protein, partial [Desulfovibrio sp.]|nr:glycosyltransferase family 2 protein [Desulfovibrio sp.]
MGDAQFFFSVIIPVYNKWKLTEQCLRSLKACTREYLYEVIVVDNASTDETATCLDTLGKTLFEEHFVSIRLTENINFGPACNRGAAKARAPFLFFLNNDTILTEHWAIPLCQAFTSASPSLAAIGPLLLYENRTVQHVGVAFGVLHPLHLYRYFPQTHPAVQKKRDVQALTAAALMIRRVAFLSVGGFHEAYKNGYEDVDLCLVLRRNGHTLQCIPQSVIYHLESQTPGRHVHAQHNADILQQRCGHLFHPDVHIHGMRDGFLPFVADDLDIALTLEPQEDSELFSRAQGKPLQYWRDVIDENPLWLGGRRHVAEWAERQGQSALALLLYSELAFWSRSKADYDNLLSMEDLS